MIVVLATYIFCIINYNKVSLYFKDRAFDLYFKLFNLFTNLNCIYRAK